jgi:hypothetical protein
MNYKHKLLSRAIDYHFGRPVPPGIMTTNYVISQWPDSLPMPNDIEQAQWVADYETYLASTQCKDDELQNFLDSQVGKVIKAIALVGVDKGLWTVAELRAKYRSLP